MRQHHIDYRDSNKMIQLPNGHYAHFTRYYGWVSMTVWEGTPGNMHIVKLLSRTLAAFS